jgi:hypothetical protein
MAPLIVYALHKGADINVEKAVPHRIIGPALILLIFFHLSCGGGGGAPAQGQPPAFYVDASAGSDTNAGTDPDYPWRSLAKVSAAQFQTGTIIYLKRGSVWNEQLIAPSSGITIDAYGTGALPKIDGSREITGWIDIGGGLYSSPAVTLGSDETLGNLSENGIMMTFASWNADAAATLAAAPAGSYSYDYGNSILYVKPASAPSGNTYRGSVKIYGVSAESKSNVIVKNLEITRFSLHGIHFKNCIGCEVHDSVITKGGGATIAPNILAGNGIEFGNASRDGFVNGVSVSEIFDSGISPQTYVSLQYLSSVTIRNSQVGSCGFAGIEVSLLSNGTTTGSSISDVLISGTTITNTGRGWSGRRYGTEGNGIRIMADAGAGSMNNIRIETTTVMGSAGDGVKLGGEIGTVNMNRMDIANNAVGISLQEPSAASGKLSLTSSLVHNNRGYGILYDSPTAAGFELYHDTFSDNTGINAAVFNHHGAADIRNNIFYGSTAMTHLYSGSTLTDAVIDNNCYNDLPNMFGYNGTAYSTVASFSGATGFTLKNTSQCKNLGSSSVGVQWDYSGYPFSVPPSSGAYQFR